MVRWAKFVIAALSCLVFLGPARAEPTTIRLGYGAAVEEQLWLMLARPDLAPNLGKAYKLDPARFPSAEKRVQAFEAGAIDITTGNANSLLYAASEGIDFRVVASLSKESAGAFHTLFLVKEDSPIRSVRDLRGKTIGLNAMSGAVHLWVKIVLEKAGLDAERDVTMVPVPFPAHGESLRAGKIDVGAFPQPFARIEQTRGGVRTLFTSKDAAPFEEELMLLAAKPQYLAKNRKAVEAFLSDVVAATQFYLKKPDEARRALIESKQVRVAPEIFLGMEDYKRDPMARVDVQALERMQLLQINAAVQRKAVDVSKMVDLSYLPK